MSRAFFVILISAVSVAVGMGARQSLGLFLQPISDSLGTGRETFSLAIAIQNILFGLPFAGMLADKIGPRWVVVGGAAIYAAGFGILSVASSVLNLYVGMGVLVGLALSATSYVVVLGAVGRVVPAERRSTAFGIVTAAGSLGTFAAVPGMQWLITAVGWESTLWYAAIAVGIIALFALGYPSGHSESGAVDDAVGEHLGTALRNACTHSGYLLLNIGFFVCGFHVAFIATHLPAYLADYGLPKMIAATALSLIGLFNMGGSYFFGRLGDHYRKKYLLSLLYGIRAFIITCFLIVPVTNVTALIFACLIGFVWLATVPLTSGTVAQIFGSRHLSSLYGIVFFSHQIGSFIGVWLGGRIYDASGSYDLVWVGAILLGIAASLVHLPIKDGAFQSAKSNF